MRNLSGEMNNDFLFDDHAASPDQLAVVWDNSGSVVAATPRPSAVSGSYEIDSLHLPSDLNIAGAINQLRANRTDVGELSENTLYLTPVRDYSERTRLLALDGERLALSDDELAEWLIEAERQVLLGVDNHPFFETPLEDTACTIRRLPNGQVSMTEVPRSYVAAARDKMRSLSGRRLPRIDLFVETSIRAAARYFLTALPQGAHALRPGAEREVTIFLLIGKAGYSYGLWSPVTGLFSEYAFLAPKEIDQKGAPRTEKMARPFVVETAEGERNIDDYVRYVFDQILLQLSPDKLEHLLLSNYGQIVWASEPDLTGTVEAQAAEYTAKAGAEFFQMPAPIDEVVAAGLLLGSFTFGDATVSGAELLPPVNLARDILELSDTEQIERRHLEEIREQQRRNRVAFSVLAAPVFAAAVLAGIVGILLFSQTMTAIREVRADARTQELKPTLDRRNSYEANLKWYQEFIRQVSRLRKQQPAGIGLLYQLNSNYPFAIDPSFYVSDMKLLPTGVVEMRGLARNKDAIASFLKTLEFAGGPESGSRLFSNLAYEVQESAAAVPGQTVTAPAGGSLLTGSSLTGGQPAPGVITWSIKGNYVPVAQFVPPPAKPAAAATPAPASAASPAK